VPELSSGEKKRLVDERNCSDDEAVVGESRRKDSDVEHLAIISRDDDVKPSTQQVGGLRNMLFEAELFQDCGKFHRFR
jgi:hypothetical protein